MKIYKQKVTYTGLNGTQKEKEVSFTITQKTLLSILEVLGYTDLSQQGIEDAIERLIENRDVLKLVKLIQLVITRSYAKIDYEEDIIDQSEEVQNKFANSLVFMAMMDEFIKNPKSIEEFLEGVSDTIETTPEMVTKQDELKAKFADKVTKQVEAPLTPEQENELLRRKLAILEGGQL